MLCTQDQLLLASIGNLKYTFSNRSQEEWIGYSIESVSGIISQL